MMIKTDYLDSTLEYLDLLKSQLHIGMDRDKADRLLDMAHSAAFNAKRISELPVQGQIAG